jgi:class 3 adenylate cyclase
MTSPALAPPAPTVVPLLIAFADLTHYGAESSRLDDRRLAEIMDEFYERVSARIEAGGGTVVKFLGDAALVVFPEERVDQGIAALLELKREIDAFFEDLGWPSRLLVKAHFGTVVAGPFGAARQAVRPRRPQRQHRGDPRHSVVRAFGRGVPTARSGDPQEVQEAHASDHLHPSRGAPALTEPGEIGEENRRAER